MIDLTAPSAAGPPRDAVIREFYGRLTAAEIADRLGGGTTRDAVIGRARRLGLHIPRDRPRERVRPAPLPFLTRFDDDMADWTGDDLALLRREWGNGKSAGDIGAMLGRSRNSVIGKAFRLGLSAKTPASIALPTTKPRTKTKDVPAAAAAGGSNGDRKRPVPPAAGVTLLDLGPRDCRFPVAGEGRHTRFCGHDVDPAASGFASRRSYCPKHGAVAVGKDQKRLVRQVERAAKWAAGQPTAGLLAAE